jgi:hypothetical protein
LPKQNILYWCNFLSLRSTSYLHTNNIYYNEKRNNNTLINEDKDMTGRKEYDLCIIDSRLETYSRAETYCRAEHTAECKYSADSKYTAERKFTAERKYSADSAYKTDCSKDTTINI